MVAGDKDWSADRTIATRTDEVMAAPSPHLVVLTGPRVGRHVPVRGRVLLGRGADCDLALEVDDVSRRHAEVRAGEDGGFLIEDLGSQNGTWVNGLPVDLHPLQPGDRVRLGTRCLVMLTLYGDLEEQLLHQQRMESLGLLAGGIAHDFNNLMSVVLGNAEYVEGLVDKREGADPDMLEAAKDLQTAAQHAADLTRQLLALARRTPVEERAVSLPNVVDEVVRILSHELASVQVTVEAEQPLDVVGDPVQLRQVIMNLCVNARDAMPDGGRLTVRARRRQVQGQPVAEVEVEDEGSGLRPEEAQRIFEPFFSRKTGGRGTGLGLAIVKRIVENHEGAIDVRSEPGRGTCFTVRLPMGKKLPGNTTPTVTPVEPFLRAGRERPGVLVVSADGLRARTLARSLGQIGYRSVISMSADEAPRMLESMRADIGLTILDLDIGGVGPVEACRSLRRVAPEVHVILSAGSGVADYARLVDQCGAQGMLQRPFERARLATEVGRLIG